MGTANCTFSSKWVTVAKSQLKMLRRKSLSRQKQENDPENQSVKMIEKEPEEVIESPKIVAEEISGKELPSAKEEKIKTEAESSLKENVVVSRSKSIPASNQASKEEMRKPSIQYDIPVTQSNEAPTILMHEYDTALKQKLSLGENIELQYHDTKVIDHSIQINGEDLSELKEITGIIVLERGFQKYLGTMAVHSRSIGNRKLDIVTQNTDNNEVIGNTLRTFVRNDNNGKSFTRAMSSSELKKFINDWNKLWKPSFTDIDLQDFIQTSAQADENLQKNQIMYKPLIDAYLNQEKNVSHPDHELKVMKINRNRI